MNSPIQWFLLLLCDRRTAPTLFSTLAWYPPVGGTRRIGKDSPVHRPDGLRPSRRRIAARDQRFEGYPNTLACHIRRAAGTHEYLYYDSAGQRRAEGWRPPSSRTTNAPARSLSHGGTAQEVASCLFSPHTTCISSMFSTLIVLFHMQWVPPAARPLCRTTLPLSSPSILPKPPRETRAPLSI